MAVKRGQLGVKKGLKRATVAANGEHISDCSIRRLARRGGIRRMGRSAYVDSRTALNAFLRPIVHDIVLLAEHGRRFTVKVTDVLLALKRNGRTLYGFGEAMPCLEKRAARLRRRPTAAARRAAAEALAAEERVPGDSSSTLLRDPTTASPEDQGPRALTCMLPMSGATASQGIARPACIERRVLATPVMLCAPAGACTELGGGGAEMVAQDLPDAVYDRLQVDALVEGVAAQLPGMQRALCTRRTLRHVLLALQEERDALVVDGDDVYFTC